MFSFICNVLKRIQNSVSGPCSLAWRNSMEGISRTGESWLHCWLLHVQPLQAGCSPCRLAAALDLVLSTQIQSCFGSVYWRPLMAQQVKNPPAMQETQVPSVGQEGPSAGGNGNSLRYSCLKNPMDKGAWWATVQRVAKCRTWLSEKTHTYWGPRPIIIAQNTCY